MNLKSNIFPLQDVQPRKKMRHNIGWTKNNYNDKPAELFNYVKTKNISDRISQVETFTIYQNGHILWLIKVRDSLLV